MVDTLETPHLAVRRAKLRPPRPSASLVSRPRLTARLDQCLSVPLTLLSAPAGFGKTSLLAEWAASSPAPLAWLTLDAEDRDLRRFVTHLIAAAESLVPGIGLPVLDLVRSPQPASPAGLGAALADRLLDLPHEVVLVLDDYHLAASADVEAFLAGLLQAAAPSVHLVLATRSDPALPLARMRLQGHVNELRASGLRFTEDEAGRLLPLTGHDAVDPEIVAALQQQVGGWIAGLRLAMLALPAIDDPDRVAAVVAGEQSLMEFLVDEVVATQPPSTQDFLLRTAIVDRVCAPLADALMAGAGPGGGSDALARLAHESFLLEPSGDDGWFRYHPLFRSLLLHQAGTRLSPAAIAALHVVASDWYAAAGLIDDAIRHRLDARDPAGAAALVARRVLPALDREDWNAVAEWLRMLPDAVVRGDPRLLLAKAWVSHFSGRSVPIRAMMAELESLLAGLGDDEARSAYEAERAALRVAANLSSGWDRDAALADARRAVEHVSPRHRLAFGLATVGLGCALQASGRTDEAIRFLTAAVEREEEGVDAGSIRALGGLMFVHRQAGNLRACEEVANHLLTLARRNALPVAAGWAHWELGWIAYWRDDLDQAIEHFSAIVADAPRVHLHCACEAMCGLALAWQARGMTAEAADVMRAQVEMILDASALEYLPLVRGFEARLALLRGDAERAVAWLDMGDGVSIESNGIDAFDHPYLTRVKVLLAEGSPDRIERARQAIAAFLAFTAERCHAAHRAEALALLALALDAQGHHDEARETIEQSVELAAPARSIRIFLDLGPAAASLLRSLAACHPDLPFPRQILEAFRTTRATAGWAASALGATSLATLTPREADVLAGLVRRLSYQEIGAELFISMETVKSHAAHIYGKLGVSGRREALAKAESWGWLPPG